MSQMTTGPSYERVYERLRADLGDWSALLNVRTDRLARIIHDAGLSNQKAPRLKAIAAVLERDFGAVTLAPLVEMSDAQAERYLVTLPGVGVKTAKCVLMYALHRQVLPADTHVTRVAARLGLLRPGVPLPRLHSELEAAVRPADRYAFHVTAVSLGCTVCLAKVPRCGTCPVATLCPSRR